MQPGELRRFTVAGSELRGEDPAVRWNVGDIFMVLEVVQPRSAFPKQVTFLVGDRIMTGWGYPWIMNNSEALNEAG